MCYDLHTRSGTESRESERGNESIMLNLESLKVQYITDEKGKKSAAVIPIEQFYQLLEDLDDLATAAERQQEPAVPHKQVIDGLKADGLLSD